MTLPRPQSAPGHNSLGRVWRIALQRAVGGGARLTHGCSTINAVDLFGNLPTKVPVVMARFAPRERARMGAVEGTFR